MIQEHYTHRKNWFLRAFDKPLVRLKPPLHSGKRQRTPQVRFQFQEGRETQVVIPRSLQASDGLPDKGQQKGS